MKKLLLFTCFNPDIGGGGVIFRTQIAGLRGWDITWVYLSDAPCRFNGCTTIWLGKPFVGGPIIQDMVRAPFIWSGLLRKPARELAQKLVSLNPSAFWILGMNEGILLVPELQRLSSAPIHVSIQDDQERGMFARMSRYGWMSRLARKPVSKALRAASSVDVVSNGMKQYYQTEYGIDSKVTHLAMARPVVLAQTKENVQEIRIGHIGTLYDESVGIRFGEGLRALSKVTDRKIRWHMIGLATKFRRLRTTFQDIMQDHGTIPESAALEILSKCDIVYAMYPFNESGRVFRQTSFPTKMSTYLKAGRPIFAHTPKDSTMAEFVLKSELGIVCDLLDANSIANELLALCKITIPPHEFESAAEKVFGHHNVEVMQGCLDSLLPTADLEDWTDTGSNSSTPNDIQFFK
jgi:hypothetical protein